jgi:hypothetical protein
MLPPLNSLFDLFSNDKISTNNSSPAQIFDSCGDRSYIARPHTCVAIDHLFHNAPLCGSWREIEKKEASKTRPKGTPPLKLLRFAYRSSQKLCRNSVPWSAFAQMIRRFFVPPLPRMQSIESELNRLQLTYLRNSAITRADYPRDIIHAMIMPAVHGELASQSIGCWIDIINCCWNRRIGCFLHDFQQISMNRGAWSAD